MAETKTGGQRRTRSPKGANKRTTSGKPSSASKNKPGSASKSNGARGRTKQNADQPKADGAEVAGEEQKSTLARVASQAKAPLMSGAAAAGLLGAVAISRNRKRGGISLPGIGKKRRHMPLPNVSMPKVPKPHAPQLKGDGKATRKALGATARAVGSAAAEVGKAGYRVGELTAEIREVREQARQDQNQR